MVTLVPTKFQFLHGAIKSYRLLPVTTIAINFNSYMVRLKEVLVGIDTIEVGSFQFLHGAIKRLLLLQ